MLGTHALDQYACLLYLYQTSDPAIFATGSVDIFTISMFDLAHMSETKTTGQQLYKQQLRETVRPVAEPMSLNFAL